MRSALALLLVVVALTIQPAGVYGAQRPAGCSKRVPLYPGYPGYRGNVPGLAGVGDYLCVETLKAMDPTFSQYREDSANFKAAKRLGLRGSYVDWTWEHIMMIEAARGLPLHCYSCLLFDPALQPTDPTIRPKVNDPRILAGLLSRPFTIPVLVSQFNEPLINNKYQSDYELRVPSFLWYRANRGAIPTASELVSFYTEFMTQASQPGGWDFNAQWMIEQAIAQGGYVPTSATAPDDDQVFMIGMAVLATRPVTIPISFNAILSMFKEQMTDWRLARAQGQNISFAHYLQQHWQI